MNRALLRLGAACVLAACASESPATVAVADGITSLARVELLADEMARLDGVRMPLDEVILRLRWRARAMDEAQRAAFGVHVTWDPDLPAAAERGVMAAKSRLLDEIDAMDVGYVKT